MRYLLILIFLTLFNFNSYAQVAQNDNYQFFVDLTKVENDRLTIELITPIAMEEGLKFAIREGGRTVGSGVVSKILK